MSSRRGHLARQALQQLETGQFDGGGPVAPRTPQSQHDSAFGGFLDPGLGEGRAAILAQLSVRSGRGMGEVARKVKARALLERAVGTRSRIRIEAPADLVLRLPPRLVEQAVRRLLDNALAADPKGEILLSATALESELRIEVVDRGEGMSAEVRERAGEPFFTTRPEGAGMGLGLYFARSVAEQLGGRLTVDSAPGEGTRVVLTLPREVTRGA